MREILIEVDKSCKMARVSLDNKCIMEGNYWDFSPDCHGINTYGDFNDYAELAGRIYSWLIREEKEDFRNIKTTRKDYKYNHTPPKDSYTPNEVKELLVELAFQMNYKVVTIMNKKDVELWFDVNC